MSSCPEQHDELAELLTAMSDTGLNPPQARRLAELMRDDPAVKQLYLDFVELHTMLVWQHKEGKEERGTRSEERGLGTSVPSGAGIILPIPDLSAPHSSFLIPPSTSLSSFVGGAVFSYLIAAMIVGVGLLIAWAWKLPDRTQFARQSVSSPLPLAPNLSFRMEFVGRITGMVDCDFADASTVTFAGSNVPLGRKYALASGLLEITYDTGAKVILQGPCTYEVESAAGGYLSVGKLTARVEKKEERRTKNEELSVSSSSLLIPHSYFAVRTPTATVTDLGTEFGVEVSKEGNTTSHVFRGSVRLQATSPDGKAEGTTRVLHENESASVENSAGNQGGDHVTVFAKPAKLADFVREIPRDNPKPTIKTFDLVDVVAGGDGFSGRRSAYIDPTNGRVMDMSSQFDKDFSFVGDGKYHRVDGLPFVDGVFIPNGQSGPVQTDSAGHAFAGFAETSNLTLGYLRAGGEIPTTRSPYRPSQLGGVDYASAGHGLLFLHANKAITFNLDAIRRANPDYRLVRFCAVAGNTETVSEKGESVYADLWVLVDGQLRFRRREINGCTGASSVVIAVDENDRFLTLAATDSGNGNSWDWILFGDPRIELCRANATTSPTVERKESR